MKKVAALVGAAWAIGLAGSATAAPAAGDNAMKVCGARYQAAKAGKTLPAGQTWNQYLASCRTGLGATTVKTSASVSTHTVTRTTSTTATPAQLAMRSRQQACAKQWQADKAAGKVPAGQTWPKYWSQCSARMKG